MLVVRKSADRGHINHGWLDTQHSFCFGSYYHPDWQQFGTLRVINEDHIAGGQGFGGHPHQNMEIITYLIAGALEHKDSLGNGKVINQNEVQRMSAGSGIEHSEFNPLSDTTTHLLQIWFVPAQLDVTPSYEQQIFSDEDKRNTLCLLVTGEPNQPTKTQALSIHQSLSMYASLLDNGKTLHHQLDSHRQAWVQLISGQLIVNDQALQSGDGLAIDQTPTLTITCTKDAHFVLFDMQK